MADASEAPDGASAPATRPSSSSSKRSHRSRRKSRSSVRSKASRRGSRKSSPGHGRSKSGGSTPSGVAGGDSAAAAAGTPVAPAGDKVATAAGPKAEATPEKLATKKVPAKPGERYTILLFNPGSGHSHLIRHLKKAGFKVVALPNIHDSLELIRRGQAKHPVRLILAELSEDPRSVVQLLREVKVLTAVSIPSLLMCPSVDAVNSSPDLTRWLKLAVKKGCCGLVERPVNLDLLAMRCRILMDRFGKAEEMYTEVCDGGKQKARLASAVSMNKPSQADNPVARDGTKQTAKVTDASIDNQYYSPVRAAHMRRARITKPWEERKHIDDSAAAEADDLEVKRAAEREEMLAKTEASAMALVELSDPVRDLATFDDFGGDSDEFEDWDEDTETESGPRSGADSRQLASASPRPAASVVSSRSRRRGSVLLSGRKSPTGMIPSHSAPVLEAVAKPSVHMPAAAGGRRGSATEMWGALHTDVKRGTFAGGTMSFKARKDRLVAASQRDQQRLGPRAKSGTDLRRLALDEIKDAEARALKGERLRLPDALSGDPAATESWKTWMSFDILLGDPIDPDEVPLSMIGKADFWVQKGDGASKAGMPADAVRMLTKAIKIDPRCWVAYLLRGINRCRLRKFARAQRDLEKYLSKHPTDALGQYNLAIALSALGDLEPAMESLNKAIDTCPRRERHPYLFTARGMLLRRQGKFLAANADYIVAHNIRKLQNAEKKSTEVDEIGDASTVMTSSTGPAGRRASGHSRASGFRRLAAARRGPASSSHSVAATAAAPLLAPVQFSNLTKLAPGDIEAGAREITDAISNTTDIYTNIFAQPTAVQTALNKAGKQRTPGDLRAIAQMLHMLDFFRNMPAKQQTRFCKIIRYRQAASGEYICKQGDEQGDFFILMSGLLLVKIYVEGVRGKSEITINTIKPGHYFGQLSLLFNTRRGVSVVCKGRTELLCLSRRACDKLGLREVFMADMQSKVVVFERSAAFPRFEPDRLRFLAALAQPVAVPPGTVLVEQGQLPQTFYILKRGVCVVQKTHDVLADVELRITEIQHELETLGIYYVYHRDLRRKRRLSFDDLKEELEEEERRSAGRLGAGRTTKSGDGGDRRTGSTSPVRKGRGRGKGRDDREGHGDFTTEGVSKREALRAELRVMLHKREKILNARGAFSKTLLGAVGNHIRSEQKRAEVDKLFPPAIFGEQTILNPYDGYAPASIVAETWVECLGVNKQQLNQFAFTKEHMSDVRRKALVHPSNEAVYKKFRQQAEWKEFRQTMLRSINKSRWPVSKERIRHLPGGDSIVV